MAAYGTLQPLADHAANGRRRPRSRHSVLRDEPTLSCSAASGCGALPQSRRAGERGAIG